MPKSTHNFLTKKQKLPRFYVIWSMMKQRCFNKNHIYYRNYGGRGISVCNDWLNFKTFKDDMYNSYLYHLNKYGEQNTTIDRKNNNDNYCKENCKWSTLSEQMFNTRQSVSLAERVNKLYKITGLPKELIKKRIQHKWNDKKIIMNKPFFKYYSSVIDNRHKIDLLTIKQKNIINYRYGLHDGITHSLRESGIKFGVPKQNILDVEKRAIRNLTS